MDHDIKTKVTNDFITETFHPDYISWRYRITRAEGTIEGSGTLYHESMGEPIKGHASLIKFWQENYHGWFLSYVNPHDGSDAYFDLRKGLHSVKTLKVKDLNIFQHNYNIPKST